MSGSLRRWWPWIKLALCVAVVAGVGWHLYGILNNDALSHGDDLRSPAQVLGDAITSAHRGGLLLAGLFYLAGLALCGAFWIVLTRAMGEPLPALPAMRAYYLGHLGKYAPGKGLALAVRTALAADAGCRPSVALLTSIYETLATMASGALVAAILLVAAGGDDKALIWKSLALLVLAVVPILPSVFNRAVAILVRRILRRPDYDIPVLLRRYLPIGILFTMGNWFLFGASLEGLLWSLNPETYEPSWEGFVRSTTFVAVAYIIGFAIPTPGGLGVREFMLQQLLAESLGAQAVVAALLLRLLWTVAEIVAAAALWHVPRRSIPRSPEANR